MESNTNISSDQLSIFEIEGVDPYPEPCPGLLDHIDLDLSDLFATSNFNYNFTLSSNAYSHGITSVSPYSFTNCGSVITTNPLDSGNAMQIHGEVLIEIPGQPSVKVGETLEQVNQTLDAVVERMDILLDILKNKDYLNKDLEDLVSLKDLIEQQQMINILKRGGDV